MIGMRRNPGYAEAISELCPNAQWAIRDNDYSTLEWFSPEIPIPDKSIVDQKIIELKNNEPMRMMREIRDWYLKNTDWTQGADIRAIRGPEWCNAWDTYRQELRDITETQTPFFENEYVMHLSGVVWPKQPSDKSV